MGPTAPSDRAARGGVDSGGDPQRGPLVEVRELSFAYGDRLLLDCVSFSVGRGEFVAVIGPNGCGQSTMLLILAGLLRPKTGVVQIGGERVQGPGADRAVVFQGFQLLPWKNVLDNVALGLRYRRPDLSYGERDAAARRYIEQLGVEGFEDAFPHQLSGGMQQRAALARAFVLAPDLLLMDEPFSGIDAQNAEIMRRDLRDLAMRERRTVVFVTHDLDEALFLSDRILAMSPRPGAIVDDVTVDKRDLAAVDAGPSGRQPKARVALWERVYRRPS